ncbi:MAG: zinc-ribbon and DUF3426 domain-containing protein [Gallionella sp.]|nr:zinc-ribbon and DUF3426 domain-containing protein [Gallionella sp.]
MDGTTLCPHCDTRFKIAGEQLHARQGMVRCGHCLQIFDARTNFQPDEPDPQLELPMLDEPVTTEAAEAESIVAADDSIENQSDEELLNLLAPEPEPLIGELDFSAATRPVEIEEPPPPPVAPTHTPTLAEQVAMVQDNAPPEEDEPAPEPVHRSRLWLPASALLLVALLMQATYFFRVELAARLPGLKPVLVAACQPLKCTVPLPQNADLMSIESSELEADPSSEARINLNVLLRNRAGYALDFPDLELTLTDLDDKALARRVFNPADYLPGTETASAGLRPNRELNIRLLLDISDLRPAGYRLVLFYPQ